MASMMKTYFAYWPNIFHLVTFFVLLGVNFAVNDPLNSPQGLIFPILITPFYEWCLHKYFLHLKLENKAGFLYRFMDRSHYAHHRNPAYPPLIFAQIELSLLIGLKMFLIFWAITGSPIKALWPLNTISGIYLFYEWTHLSHHLEGHTPITAWGRYLKKLHQWHHFKNENYWWGITSPIADFFLGTLKDAKDVEKSETTKNIDYKLSA